MYASLTHKGLTHYMAAEEMLGAVSFLINTNQTYQYDSKLYFVVSYVATHYFQSSADGETITRPIILFNIHDFEYFIVSFSLSNGGNTLGHL